jgi:hypothetical protein
LEVGRGAYILTSQKIRCLDYTGNAKDTAPKMDSNTTEDEEKELKFPSHYEMCFHFGVNRIADPSA